MPRTWMLGTLGTITVFALAELLFLSGVIESEYLPSPLEVLFTAFGLIGDSAFLTDVGSTVAGWSLALLLGGSLAIPAGVVLALSSRSYSLFSPLVAALRPIPAVALIPLAVLVWGSGLDMKIYLTTFAVVWPILINTMYGVREVDPVARETAAVFGLGRWAILTRVVLPSAGPLLMTGFRVAVSLGLVVIVGVELFAGATDGIGSFVLLASYGGGDLDRVIAGAVWAGALGVLGNGLFSALDSRLFAWARRGVVS